LDGIQSSRQGRRRRSGAIDTGRQRGEAIAKGFDFRAAFKWDCEKIIDGDAIYMLKGWEKSPGARAEHAVAQFVKTHNPSFEFMYQ
jgi:hypothetical protein